MMKKYWIIIGAIITIIALLGVGWWYLISNGRPDTVFGVPNPFGVSGSNEFTPTTIVDIENEPRVFETTLRQLTDTPVAGALFIDGVASSTRIRYVARGTGHIFDIDPETGNSTRIIGTTIPRTITATWSPFGTRVVIIAENTLGLPRVFTGAITRGDDGEYTLVQSEINSNAQNITFTSEGESIFYTVTDDEGSTGYRHDLKTNERTVVFLSPLRNIRVASWEPLLTYTAPTASLKGYAYAGADFRRLYGGVEGLIVSFLDDAQIVSHINENVFVSHLNTIDGPQSAIPIFPEKCALDQKNDGRAWCAIPLILPSGTYPDDWYKGKVSFSDIIWQLDLTDGSASLVSIPSKDARADIDAVSLSTNNADDMLIFINKKDGTLWLQKLDE